jgi:sugar O-acyltransferase (sialic acid O-acetyltransferase NeuD family)
MAADSLALLVWGAGGHGRVVADVARAGGAKVVGFIDRDTAKVGSSVAGGCAIVVASGADMTARLSAGEALPRGATAIALGIGDNRLRSACRAGIVRSLLPPLVHPSAVVSPSAVIGSGAVVMPRAVINAGATIGEGAIVNSGAVIEHDCVVGNDAHISPGAVLAGGVVVGPGAWVGAGATLIPNIRVGEWAVVGAGAVVIRDVAGSTTVVGSPARPLTPRASS